MLARLVKTALRFIVVQVVYVLDGHKKRSRMLSCISLVAWSQPLYDRTPFHLWPKDVASSIV